MSFVRYKRTKSGTYAYRVTSYWDKKMKRTRQKTEYLGKVTEDGIKKVRLSPVPPRAALNYGDVSVLYEIITQQSLPEILRASHGVDTANVLIGLAIYRLLSNTSISAFKTWLESSYLSEITPLKNPSSQNLSRILEHVGRDEHALQRFFYEWCMSQGIENTLMYDITSLSSSSKLIELLEYGYNRDNDGLPQVNMGLIAGVESHLPLFYKLFPGSITDVSTLSNLISEVKSLGITETLFVLDRGFYSKTNIHRLLETGFDFVMPMPFSVKDAQRIISETNPIITSPEHAVSYGDKIIYTMSGWVAVGEHRVRYHIYFDEERQAREVNSFYQRLIAVEEKLNGRTIQKWENPDAIVADTAKNLRNCLTWEVKSNKIQLKRKKKAITRLLNRMGKTIILCSRNMSWEDTLSFNRGREVVERMFRTVKNDLSGLPLRVHKEHTLKGYLLVVFISLIIYFELTKRMKKTGLQKNSSMETLLMELGKLRMVQLILEFQRNVFSRDYSTPQTPRA